eukprot:CAMPEP_0194395964 /NCGR_PEP_ID=MMETSP0174-20130528/124715_1 /TAXON_ID=216777 /ORGANISM="Proboscia alata, Strain PI-D3" /LENGTH=212 /DNA_ID=CAMNT_0039191955 /DNA_START=3 /DNA_END=641 /DNA_ORIENTATION=-
MEDDSNALYIGNQRPEMAPNPHPFYDIPIHVNMIQTLLCEWEQSGERSFLLLGNQGVGKNKIVDRICQLANFEREYIQLHRDSSISSPTVCPTLENGKIVWNDSPLVRAATRGCVLVIDEADKAPTHILTVLKSLVADGQLLLSDGRRLTSSRFPTTNADSSVDSTSNGSNDIATHPDFTVFVLANRAGFPFHGNDFLPEIGDCFFFYVILN